MIKKECIAVNNALFFLLILSRKVQTKLNIHKSLGLKLVTYT